jgi:hypothetical protein
MLFKKLVVLLFDVIEVSALDIALFVGPECRYLCLSF